MGSKNKEMFEIGKAAAIANIAIETPKTAMSVYSALAPIPFIGPGLGIAAAVAAIAYGAEQIGTVANTQFNPGGAAKGISGYGFTEPMISTFQPTEITIPENFAKGIAEGRYALTGSGGSSGTVNMTFIVQSNGLDNARDITRKQIIPELEYYFAGKGKKFNAN